jgi:hypothetical protein
MAIIFATDIEIRLSIPGAAAGDADAQPDPNDSRGEFISTTVLTDSTLDNLIRSTTGPEGESGITLYACLFIANKHASLTYQAVKVWLSSQTAGGGTLSIGLDPAGVVAIDAMTAQAEVIADEETAPTGVTFTAPTSVDDALSIGDIAPDECQAVWVRVIFAPDTAAQTLDGAILQWKGLSNS